VQPRKGDLHQPNLGVGTCDRWSGRRIYRRMKREDAKCAEAVVGDDLVLRAELTSRVALMEVGESKNLGGENQSGAEERNRFCAPSNRLAGFSPPRNHRLKAIIAVALRRYPPA